MGEHFSLADICIVPTITRMDDLGYASLWQDAPRVSAWFDRIRERPAYREAFYFGSLLSEQYPDIKDQLAQ